MIGDPVLAAHCLGCDFTSRKKFRVVVISTSAQDSLNFLGRLVDEVSKIEDLKAARPAMAALREYGVNDYETDFDTVRVLYPLVDTEIIIEALVTTGDYENEVKHIVGADDCIVINSNKTPPYPIEDDAVEYHLLPLTERSRLVSPKTNPRIARSPVETLRKVVQSLHDSHPGLYTLQNREETIKNIVRRVSNARYFVQGGRFVARVLSAV